VKQLGYLVGTWNCSSANEKFRETWAYALGGVVMRATDQGKETQEHTLAYARNSNSMTVVDYFTDGSSDVMRGTGSSTHAAFHAVYPPGASTTVAFNRLTDTKYTIDVAGLQRGKSFKDRYVCTKT